MKNLFNCLAVLRLPTAAMIAFLTNVGFLISEQKTDWWLVIAVFLAVEAVFLEEAYRKRQSIFSKTGNDFVLKNKKTFRILFHVLLSILFVFAVYYYQQSHYLGKILFLGLNGILFLMLMRYISKFISFLLIPFLVVLPVLLSLDAYGYIPIPSLLFIIGIFALVLAREMLCLSQDDSIHLPGWIDWGQIISFTRPLILIGAVFCFSALKDFSGLISFDFDSLNKENLPLLFGGLLIIVPALFLSDTKMLVKTAKDCLDEGIGVVVIVAALFF